MKKPGINIRRLLYLVPVCGVVLCGCKPTEKNYADAYSKAYEAAQRKAEADRTGEDGIKLESMEGPTFQTFGTDTVQIGTSRLKPFETGESTGEGSYGIAIAKYSMPTNARSHLKVVRNEYPDAFIASDGQQGFYVMIKRVPTVSDATDPIRIYLQNHPGDSYMGLDGNPMVYFITPK